MRSWVQTGPVVVDRVVHLGPTGETMTLVAQMMCLPHDKVGSCALGG